MDWGDIVLIGGNALVSMGAVTLSARFQGRREKDSWLVEKRLAAVVRLKLAIGEVRSDVGKAARSNGGTDLNWNFSEVNAAMTEVEMVGPPGVAEPLDELRSTLRELVRAVDNGDDWRLKRTQVDRNVGRIIGIMRGA